MKLYGTMRHIETVDEILHLLFDSLTSVVPKLDSYPMSQFLRCLPCSQLSYEARELACHFADAYFVRLKGKVL